MPSNGHAAYRSFLEEWIRNHAGVPAIVEQLRRYKVALLVLWHLDLEPARPLLRACYAGNPRGSRPRDPVVMLRGLLLQLLVGQPSINEWADDLEGSMVLRALAGLRDEEPRPGVGTWYDFLARVHDGPVRKNCEHTERPSVSVKVMDNPRLCPTIPRDSEQYHLLYNRRSGCERSNSVKKDAFHLAAARHRRASFWLVRLHLIALLQHARAWVANENADQLLDHLLAKPEVTAMAA